jgi:hypothetical protein
MSRLDFDQIQPPLNPLYTLIESVHAAMNPRHAFLDMGHSNFEILTVVNKAINTLLHPRQARLDLLQHRHDEVGDFAHVRQHICSCDVPQDAMELG